MSNNSLKYYFLFFLVLIIILLGLSIFYLPDGLLRVYFLDIGQGDSFLIVSPSGNQTIIDGGPGQKILEKLGAHLPFYDRKIELLILTHPQADHLAGFIEVLKRYQVEKILTIDVEYDSAVFREWSGLIKEKRIEFIPAQAGQIVELGGGAYFLVFYPFNDLGGRLVSSEEINDLSITGKLIYGDLSALFTGDGEIKEEINLMRSGFNLKSNILKVAHHGSKTSTHSGFLKSVNPQIAVISAGRDNRYNHPHQTVLDRLNSLGIKILRTDILRDINFISDGHFWKID